MRVHNPLFRGSPIFLKPKAPRRCPHDHWNYTCRPMIFCDDCGEILTGVDPYNHVGRFMRRAA